MGSIAAPYAEWGIAESALAGQAVSGDRALVRAVEGGLLIAVVDGAGHGLDAARAAEAALAAVEAGTTHDPEAILQNCHAALRDTRGAAVMVAWFDGPARRLDWACVGEILGVLVRVGSETGRQRQVLLPRQGVVGRAVRQGSPFSLRIEPGDLLVLATDGVRDSFVGEVHPGEDCVRHSQRLLERHRRVTDDALLVAIRFQPRPHDS